VNPLFYLLFLLVSLSSFFWLVLLYRFIKGFANVPVLERFEEDGESCVTAVIPARNEERCIAQTIESLLMQKAISKIIVVDDCSNDDTLSIAKRYQSERVLVLQTGEIPQGWVGKNYACALGAKFANTPWILFLDADTFVKDQAVSKALTLAKQKSLDALSLSGELRTHKVWDEIVTPFLYSLLNSFIKASDVNDPSKGAAYFFGSFILIKRSVYEALGGHEAVKDKLVEDRALAVLAKKNHFKISLARTSLVSAEYAPGVKNSVRAIERVARQSMQRDAKIAFGFCVAISLLFFLPYLGLSFVEQDPTHLLFVFSVLGLLAPLALSVKSAKMIRSNPLFAILFPVAQAHFAFALWLSFIKSVTNAPVIWRERAYTKQISKI
jgi:chlorobactene glucosyltransferase